MRYGILDTKKTPEAQDHNEKLLGSRTLGIEVTIPELALKCGAGNIDPQHSLGQKQAAIEAVFSRFEKWDGLDQFDTVVTIRPDLDSIGAMAIIEMLLDQRWQYNLDPNGSVPGSYCHWRDFNLKKNSEVLNRIDLVAKADSFQNGAWRPYPLPSRENPWPAKSDIRELAAIAAAVADFKIPVEQRVIWMADWLLFGKEPVGYREKVEKERMEMIDALENGSIKIETRENVSIVTSTYRAATMIGYASSPIVVAVNPEFRFQGGDPHRKITICQYQEGYVDLKKVAEQLNMIEPGWGGSPTIIGSPQGRASIIMEDQLLEAIQKNMR